MIIMKKYLVTASKEINVDGTWCLKTFELSVEAETMDEAEWEVRKQGYSPLYTKKG